MTDVTLVNLWTEPVFVLPSYSAVRQEIRQCWKVLARRKLEPFLSKRTASSAYWDITRHSTSLPVTNGLLSVAGTLETHGISVQYVNLESERRRAGESADWLDRVADQICRHTRHAVGVSVLSHECERAMRFLSAIKARSQLKTFVGGAHGSFLDNEVAAHDAVDAVVRFEGEMTAVELVNAWREERDLANVEGITFRKDGIVVRNPARPPVHLPSLPLPAYHLIDHETLQAARITTTFGRGCNFRCAYCAEGVYWQGSIRYKEPRQFACELRIIAEQLGQRFIHISDSTFGLDRNAVVSLCRCLEAEPIDALFSVNARHDVFEYLGEDILKRLLHLGFVEFLLGLETASDELTASWGRKQTLNRLTATLQRLKDMGIPIVAVYTFIGGPNDTAEGLQQTINTTQHLLSEDLIFHALGKFFMPAPGTAVYNDPPKYGYHYLESPSSRYDRHSFPLPYIHRNLSQFELLHYLALLQSVQLAHYMKQLRGERLFTDRFQSYAEQTFVGETYL